MGAGNCVTSCDLRVFVDQATEPVPAVNPDLGAWSWWMRTPGRRVGFHNAVMVYDLRRYGWPVAVMLPVRTR